ncbi:hypothetical protein K3X41_05685 [Aliiroseovarius crassostreae]|uniref:hypothetical protein n=1 Tax=Aliiroseovarius crassostreae TaxID=154981 RepID=UPI00220C22B1|nr:hypothetical protein [Aliiroseovarius crassostreae]UWQ12159.1 hypothetical protein K3X41_05685 [Aliiroseovarius crassostreae]
MQIRFSPLVIGAAILLGGVSVAAGEPAEGGMSCVVTGFAGSEVKSICVQQPVVVSTAQKDQREILQLTFDDQLDVFIPTVGGGSGVTRRAQKFDSDKRPKALLKRAVDLVSTCLEFEGCPEKEFWNSAAKILARCAEDHEYYLLDSPLMLSLVRRYHLDSPLMPSLVRRYHNEQMLNQVFGEMLECRGNDELLFISSNKFSTSNAVERDGVYFDTIKISDGRRKQ